jgi:hypothetical protein
VNLLKFLYVMNYRLVVMQSSSNTGHELKALAYTTLPLTCYSVTALLYVLKYFGGEKAAVLMQEYYFVPFGLCIIVCYFFGLFYFIARDRFETILADSRIPTRWSWGLFIAIELLGIVLVVSAMKVVVGH